MVGCEIRGEFVEVWFRNRLGNAQQFLPYRARLFGLGGAATLAATFWGSGTRGGSCAHDGWNYSGESLRCLRVAEELLPFLPLSSCRVTRLSFTARIQRGSLFVGMGRLGDSHCPRRASFFHPRFFPPRPMGEGPGRLSRRSARMPRSEERGGMAARSEAEMNSLLVYKSPARQGGVLYCAHRATVIHLNDPSKLACFPSLGMAPVLVPLQPSSEVTDDPSKLARYLFRDGG